MRHARGAPMPQHVKPHPVEVNLFGCKATVQLLNPLPTLMEEAGGLQNRFAVFHGCFYNCAKTQFNDRKPNKQATCGEFE
jgi:hypothetical protein